MAGVSRRAGVRALSSRIGEPRVDLSAWDATYGAVAEALDAPLVTADGRSRSAMIVAMGD